MEFVICSTPSVAALPDDLGVQTLVAMKARSCCAGVSRSPSTASAVEYIGDVSMTVAPDAKNACNTSRSGARAESSMPTSNGPDVPSPITGNASPLDGILRVIMSLPSSSRCPPICALAIVACAAAVIVAAAARNSRRFMMLVPT